MKVKGYRPDPLGVNDDREVGEVLQRSVSGDRGTPTRQFPSFLVM